MVTPTNDKKKMSDYDISFNAGKKDFEAFYSIIKSKTEFLHENHKDDLSKVVVKPWGYESRIYADLIHDLWHLCIKADASTSMHAHARKTTKLICLSGEGVFETLNGKIDIKPGVVISIGPGAFHQTHAITPELHLVEVETPRNKFDLMRLRDAYNRATATYESDVEHHGESELIQTNKMPNAYLRSKSTYSRFDFNIKTGMDIFYTPGDKDLFYIPIGFEAFVKNYPVIRCDKDLKKNIKTNQRYFTVARAK